MAAQVALKATQFALDVAEGLSLKQKKISPRYFYDALGSMLFEAITLLPEYGLTRADERVLRSHADDVVSKVGPVSVIAELGSGSGKKTKLVLDAFSKRLAGFVYRPIDVSADALAACRQELSETCEVRPVCADWLEGLSEIQRERRGDEPLLLLFLGSSIGNLERGDIAGFISRLKFYLRPGDCFLLGADLVKDVRRMLDAYDDPTGVTAAFNLNLLGRMNRELDADFDLRSFEHEPRWNAAEARIEMHLRSRREQTVYVGALDARFAFRAGETIWTESSHKFELGELDAYARTGGFQELATWIDTEWPFAETLWQIQANL